MPLQPPYTALLLLSLPPSLLVGIDLLTFTTSPRFLGIKDLPPGPHFLHTSETTSLSLRDGLWIYVPLTSPHHLIIRKWDPTSAHLIDCSDAEIQQCQDTLTAEVWKERLTPYRQNAGASSADGMGEGGGGGIQGDHDEEEKDNWAALTAHITPTLLSHFTNGPDWRITTASCAAQDADHIPGLSTLEIGLEERELQFLGIDLKRTWPEGAVGRERTEAAIDRSWALENLETRWKRVSGDVILGAMEVCFIMVMTVANYSCLEEWKRILGLVLTCKRLVRAREGWFVEFLGLLRGQLARGEDVEGGLFDMSDEGGAYLKGLLKGFKRMLGQVFGEGDGEEIKEEMAELEAFLRSEYGWELSDSFARKGMLELEDGEQVEMETDEMEGEDETGDYAPVVVDL